MYILYVNVRLVVWGELQEYGQRVVNRLNETSLRDPNPFIDGIEIWDNRDLQCGAFVGSNSIFVK